SGPAAGKPKGDYGRTATAGNATVNVTATVLAGGFAQAGCSTTATLTVSGQPNNVQVTLDPTEIPAKPKPGDPMSSQVTAHVTDAQGHIVGNENVTFSASQSPTPNSVTFGGPNDQTVPASTETVATDANGDAQATVN